MSAAAALQSLFYAELHPKQLYALHTPATEILYGGAAGGGKSYLMRVASIIYTQALPGVQIYLFRRVMEDLLLNHMEGPRGYRSILAPAKQAGVVSIIEDEIRFANGSRIYLCHVKDPKHVYKYHGAEIHVLMIDELTTFPEWVYRYLRFRVRMTGLRLSDRARAQLPLVVFPRILCSSNPGNVGHGWVKRTWIDNAAPLELRRVSEEEGGMLRQYIPARLYDNPTLVNEDPLYLARMRGLGSTELVRAMEEGDWTVVAGAYFDGFRKDVHCLNRFTPPAHWTRMRAIDWGSAAPFSVGWYALSDGNTPFPADHPFAGQNIPRGALVRYREWYGAKAPNVGLKLTVEVVAAGVVKRSGHEQYAYTVADPSMFNSDSGPSKAEKVRRRLPLRRGDNKRTHGWDELRARLDFSLAERRAPLLYFMPQHEIVRTLPDLVHDEADIEDVDTEGEDHAADECRYMCMSRPRLRAKPEKSHKPKPGTYDHLIEQDEAQERAQRGRRG